MYANRNFSRVKITRILNLIRKLAKEMGIPMVENRPLARALHAEVPVGNVIPEELYGPVAKVLAIVFKKRARQRVRGVRNRQPVS